MKLDMACVVWGEKYVNLMLNYCFSSLLANGNIPDWPHARETILQVYTTETDARTIQQHRSYAQLKQYIEVQFHTRFLGTAESHYGAIFNMLNGGHQAAIRAANQRQAAFMYIAPDHVFATDCFRTLAEFTQAGAELVMALTPRISLTCIPELEQMRTDTCLTLLPEVATDLFVTYLHPVIKAHFWDTDVFNSWCSQVYCFFNAKAVMVRGFHLHPLLMVSPPPYEVAGSTLDGEYLNYYNKRRDKVKIAQDNRLFILSLTENKDSSLAEGQFEGKLTLEQRQLLLDRFYRTVTTDIHRWFFSQAIVIQGTGQRNFQTDGDLACTQAIEAMQTLWQLEEAWLTDHTDQVLEIYQSHHTLLVTHLPDILRQACQCYVELARSHHTAS